MPLNLQDGSIYWIIPIILAITALVPLVWWIVLLVAPAPRTREERPRYNPPPPPPRQSRRAERQPQVMDQPTNMGMPVDRFVIIAGLSGVTDMTFPSNQFSIGRNLDAGANVLVSLDDTSISRKHAQIRRNPGLREYWLKDTGSTYGTFRIENGQAHQLVPNQEERVYNNDTIQFGQNVRVRLVLDGGSRDTATRA